MWSSLYVLRSGSAKTSKWFLFLPLRFWDCWGRRAAQACPLFVWAQCIFAVGVSGCLLACGRSLPEIWNDNNCYYIFNRIFMTNIEKGMNGNKLLWWCKKKKMYMTFISINAFLSVKHQLFAISLTSFTMIFFFCFKIVAVVRFISLTLPSFLLHRKYPQTILYQ